MGSSPEIHKSALEAHDPLKFYAYFLGEKGSIFPYVPSGMGQLAANLNWVHRNFPHQSTHLSNQNFSLSRLGTLHSNSEQVVRQVLLLAFVVFNWWYMKKIFKTTEVPKKFG